MRSLVAWYPLQMHRRALLVSIAILVMASAGLLGCTKSDPSSPAPAPAAGPESAGEPSSSPTLEAGPSGDSPVAESAGAAAGEVPDAPSGEASGAPAGEVLDTFVRSEAPLAIKAKVSRDPGFRLASLEGMRAVGARPGGPGYAATLTDPLKAYDDDLLTAATCTHEKDGGEACGLGLGLGSDAAVTMLRLFMAAGPDYRDYTAAPRPKRIAIHTDAGSVELDYPDGATHRYVIFAAPVETSAISVEVLDVYPGRKSSTVHFAEVEVYGVKGPSREPLELRTDEVFVYYETEPWKDKGGGEYTVRMTWLEQLGYAGVDLPGPRRRWIRGIAAYGDNDDRFVLVERALSATCEAPEVGYVMIDKETRMIYPLGALAGAGSSLYRHREGVGFFSTPAGDGAIGDSRAAIFDRTEGVFDRRRGKKTWTLAEHLSEWNFGDVPLHRGGAALDDFVADPKSHCEVVSGDDLTPILEVSEVFTAEAPGEWWSCGVGDGHRALLGRDRACGEAVSVLLRTADGTILRRAEFPAGFGPRRLAVSKETVFPGLMVEVGKEEGGASDLVPVNIDYYDEMILRDASLAVRPPPECGPCSLEFGKSAEVSAVAEVAAPGARE